ncbi:MAG: PAS domain S-box protein [Betaproteobacteria bacterium]|nr:PAS domain S-box protein [Betaproteobacteria bacterium]
MFDPPLVLVALMGFMALLLALAMWAERGGGRVQSMVDSPWVYALGLTVYNTAWSYYGSVGIAAHSGMLFLATSLGATLTWLLGGTLIRHLARFKAAHRVTNLGDFLAARYGNSGALAALATVLALLAINPYLALQLKAVLFSFHLMAGGELASLGSSTSLLLEILILLFLAGLTIVFGLRHLDPGQRQRGMMAVLAASAVVKLLAFIAVGIFVTYGMYDGLGDILQRLATLPEASGMHHETGAQWYFTFAHWLVLSMGAVLFLPRQFHVTLVELPRIGHLRTAMWLFPLYLLAMSLFVYPIAAGGLLAGHPAAEADSFVLTLPLHHGKPWVAMLAFIGGFAAALGMVIVESLALSLMVANNLLLPLAERLPVLHGLRRRVLMVRWVTVVGILAAAYGFELLAGQSHFLVSMGLISFAGVVQFAPPLLGGLAWRQASRTGALWGLSAGFCLWAYTLFLPAAVESLWPDAALLAAGPFGLEWLRPQALLGVTGLTPLAHGVFWSLLANVALFVLGSCWRPARQQEGQVVVELGEDAYSLSSLQSRGPQSISVASKVEALRTVLSDYLPGEKAEAAIWGSLEKLGLGGRSRISHMELARFLSQVEVLLAGAIGTATAHRAMGQAQLLSAGEAAEIERLYGKLLADLNLSPEELRRRVDYYHERHEIMDRHALELSEKVEDLKREIAARAQAESALRESEKRFRSMADSAPVMIWMSEADGGRSYFNRAWLEFTGRDLPQEQRQGWREGVFESDVPVWEKALAAAVAGSSSYTVQYRLRRHDGLYRWVVERGAPRLSAAGAVMGYVGSCLDITDMKSAAEALRRSRDELESLVAERTAALTNEIEQRRRIEDSLRLTQYSVDRATDSVLWVNPDGRVLYANESACHALGYTREELVSHYVYEFDTSFVKEEWPAHWQRIKEQGGALIESRQRHRDGTEIPVEVAVNYLEYGGNEYHFAFVRDISERKRAEAVLLANNEELRRINDKLAEAQNQLLQSEKMASIGQLAAGVAHEINNPIGFVNSNLTTLGGYLEDLLSLLDAYRALESKVADADALAQVHSQQQAMDLDFLRQDIPALMAETMEGVVRVRRIVKDLKEFSHVDESEWQEADLHAGLDSTLNVVWNELKYKAQVVKEYGNLPLVHCIPSQLNQVFMNLLVNAAQAIQERGTITVRTGSEADWAWIEVADTGKGIAPENLNRIFEPFFTTKPVGKGTGLGLSLSYGIVNKHGGCIEVTSVLGQGTTFRVWLPLVREEDAHVQPT